MDKELLEKMAEKVHDSWMREKEKQGYHHPSKCPERKTTGMACIKCHESIKPYDKLSEEMKELDRVMIREYENNLADFGSFIVNPSENIGSFKGEMDGDFEDFIKSLKTNVKLGNGLLQSMWIWHEGKKVRGLELYCPHCGWDKKSGGTKFEGLIAHACDPGCCCTLYCTKCGRIYGLKEDETQYWDFKEQMIKSHKTEKYFKKGKKKK